MHFNDLIYNDEDCEINIIHYQDCLRHTPILALIWSFPHKHLSGEINTGYMNNQVQIDILKRILNRLENEQREPDVFNEENQSNGFTVKSRQTAISVEIMRRFRIQNKKLMEQVALLKDQLKYATGSQPENAKDKKLLLAFNSELSEALGSCPECWGEDPICHNCVGQGVPGWRTSNKSQFKKNVLPILKKLFPDESQKGPLTHK